MDFPCRLNPGPDQSIMVLTTFDMKNSTISAETLAAAWCQLNEGQWPEDVLGEMPDFPDKQLVRRNAADAIETIVGKATISHYHFIHEFGKSDEEWFRWYTVDRFRYSERKQKHTRPVWIISAIAAVLTTIAIRIALHLSGL